MEKDSKNSKESSIDLFENTALSSEDELDLSGVVLRRPAPVKAASTLLEDGGDGSLADLLGTTPPRSRIRGKERRRNLLELESKSDGYRMMQDSMRRNTAEDFYQNLQSIEMSERLKKRASLKLIRSRERDWKLTGGDRDSRSDSLTSSQSLGYGPNLVESCSRFMSLTSRLKCKSSSRDDVERHTICSELPKSRVDFHNTFSMLIHMGNSEKGAKRTMSREEQVWQNEVADLIWLELQARLAQRSLTEQDAFLCSQRNQVANVLSNIINYRFVYKRPCKNRQQHYTEEELEQVDASGQKMGELGCLTFDCPDCHYNLSTSRIEVGSLLDAFYSAVGLFPSSHAMTQHHLPLNSTQFNCTLKAMILWYNMTQHLQFTMSSLSKLIRAVKLREERRKLISKGGGRSKSPIEKRESQVRFNLECSEDGSANSSNSVGSQPPSDRGSDCPSANTDQSTPSTPEPQPQPQRPFSSIVSAESGYLSCVESGDVARECRDIEGEGAELTVMAILGDKDSPYERYLHGLLKTQGVRRSTLFLFKIKKHVLDKVFMTFQTLDKDDENNQEQPEVAPDDECENSKNTYELKRFGWWSPERIRLSLPSYRCAALLVAAATLETVHAALTLRDLTQPISPSIFTVNQIIHELKECLEIACVVRLGAVSHMALSVAHVPTAPGMVRHLLSAVTRYDATTTSVLQQYFRYLVLTSKEKVQSRASWESESAFSGRLVAHMPKARGLARQAFTDIICNQIELQRASFMQKFEELSKREDIPDAEDDDEKKRQFVLVICRDTQHVYARHRDATLQVAQLSRLAADTRADTHTHTHSDNDNDNDHAPHREPVFESLLSLTQCISSHTSEVLTRSAEVSRGLHEASAARLRELLLQLFKLGFELHKELYRFAQGTSIDWPRYTSAASRTVSLQPERAPSVERRKRPETIFLQNDFNDAKSPHDNVELHKELHRFALSAPPKGYEPRTSATRAAPPRADTTPHEHDRWYDEVKYINIRQLLLGETSQDDTSAHCTKEAEEARCKKQQEWAEKASRCIIDYAKSWMGFVMERCDRGRGLRPRWASQGLDFLMLACDPHNTRHLSDEEFEEFKKLMDSCISHVIGSRPANPRSPPAQRPRPRLHSPLSVSTASTNSNATKSPTELLSPPTPPHYPDGVTSAEGIHDNSFTAFSLRVSSACQAVDCGRENHLREIGALGRVVAAPSEGVEPKLRQVSFPWQRGLLIGKGTFGKVYTVINTATGQLLAMKEISAGPERRALSRAANELTLLEGATHPHLVRYYGCELHVEEMLLFMELCVEGSLEARLAAAGALPDHVVRNYTYQLLSALCELHRRKIAHRDIKSGNIFLTNEGHCLKLGDFGCAVKIRANTTAMGELQGYVGTQAYMAPEVFTKSSGHGRAADVWSLGCVVTEMASGKRPFSEYDSNYSIMFVVGMGGAPAIPPSLSEEGASFCRDCLTHEPSLRPTPAHLQEHPFLNMSKSDEDCQCTTGYLITKPDES